MRHYENHGDEEDIRERPHIDNLASNDHSKSPPRVSYC